MIKGLDHARLCVVFGVPSTVRASWGKDAARLGGCSNVAFHLISLACLSVGLSYNATGTFAASQIPGDIAAIPAAAIFLTQRPSRATHAAHATPYTPGDGGHLTDL